MGLQIASLVARYDATVSTTGVKLSFTLNSARSYQVQHAVILLGGGSTGSEVQWYFSDSGGNKTLVYGCLRDSANVLSTTGIGNAGPINNQTTLNLDVVVHPGATPSLRGTISLLEKAVT